MSEKYQDLMDLAHLAETMEEADEYERQAALARRPQTPVPGRRVKLTSGPPPLTRSPPDVEMISDDEVMEVPYPQIVTGKPNPWDPDISPT